MSDSPGFRVWLRQGKLCIVVMTPNFSGVSHVLSPLSPLFVSGPPQMHHPMPRIPFRQRAQVRVVNPSQPDRLAAHFVFLVKKSNY